MHSQIYLYIDVRMLEFCCISLPFAISSETCIHLQCSINRRRMLPNIVWVSQHVGANRWENTIQKISKAFSVWDMSCSCTYFMFTLHASLYMVLPTCLMHMCISLKHVGQSGICSPTQTQMYFCNVTRQHSNTLHIPSHVGCVGRYTQTDNRALYQVVLDSGHHTNRECAWRDSRWTL